MAPLPPAAWRAGCLAAAACLLVSVIYLVLRPDLVIGEGFLFGDESANLLVAERLRSGATLYRDVAYPYGPLPIYLYTTAARVFSNTPTTYVLLLGVLSALSTGAAAALIRRSSDRVLTAAVFSLGLLPTLPVPGATVGGYLSSPYIPLERLLLLAAVIIWRPPAGRSVRRGAAVGATLALCQGVRFGSGAVALAAMLLIDLAIQLRDRSRGPWPDAARALAPVIGGFAVVQALWTMWAVLWIGGPTATEFLWPLQLLETHRASGAPRWPTLPDGRVLVAQYLMPLIAGALGVAGIARWWQRRAPGTEAGPYILLVFYILAAGVYFRHEHHFRQFAWVLVLSAVPLLRSFTAPVRVSIAILCVPALWPLLSAVLQGVSSDVSPHAVSRAYSLYVAPSTVARVAWLDRTADEHPGPVLVLPHASGWLFARGLTTPGRHTWFYSSAVIRPFELHAWTEELPAAAAVVDCTPSGAPGGTPLPMQARTALARAFFPAEARDGCLVYLPRPPTMRTGPE